MAYKIQYGNPGRIERFKSRQNSNKFIIAKYVIIYAGILTVFLLWKAGKLEALVPGDREVTQRAFWKMVEDVKVGESLESAVTTFCEEILVSAQNKN